MMFLLIVSFYSFYSPSLFSALSVSLSCLNTQLGNLSSGKTCLSVLLLPHAAQIRREKREGKGENKTQETGEKAKRRKEGRS